MIRSAYRWPIRPPLGAFRNFNASHPALPTQWLFFTMNPAVAGTGEFRYLRSRRASGYNVISTSSTEVPAYSTEGWVYDGTNDFSQINDGAGVAVDCSNLFGASAKSILVIAQPTGAAPTNANVYNLDPLFCDSGQFLGIFRGDRASAGDGIYVYNWDGSEDQLRMPFTLGKWVVAGYTHDGTTLKGFLDGVFVGSVASGATSDLTGTPQLGVVSTSFYTGSIAGIMFWDYALADGAMASMTANPYQILAQPRPLTSYYVFAAAGGRTTKNTRSHPLGVEIGMNWRVPV